MTLRQIVSDYYLSQLIGSEIFFSIMFQIDYGDQVSIPT